MTLTPIQQDILNYTRSRPACDLSRFTLQCFVGMIQTGEATLGDFLQVGDEELQQLVSDGLKIDWSKK